MAKVVSKGQGVIIWENTFSVQKVSGANLKIGFYMVRVWLLWADFGQRNGLGPVDERVGTQEGKKQRFHASVVVDIGLVRLLQGLGIAQGFVAPHEKPKDITHEDLFAMG